MKVKNKVKELLVLNSKFSNKENFVPIILFLTYFKRFPFGVVGGCHNTLKDVDVTELMVGRPKPVGFGCLVCNLVTSLAPHPTSLQANSLSSYIVCGFKFSIKKLVCVGPMEMFLVSSVTLLASVIWIKYCLISPFGSLGCVIITVADVLITVDAFTVNEMTPIGWELSVVTADHELSVLPTPL